MSKKQLYPSTPWQIIEEKFNPEVGPENETVFALGNGYIGMRGGFIEGETETDGTYLNGFYETDPIRYPEDAYGYARTNQTMLNVTNSKIIKLYVDDEMFRMSSDGLLEYERVLDLQKGFSRRSVVWQTSKGKKVQIDITRLVPLTRQHLAAIQFEVTLLNFSGKITIVSALNGEVTNQQADDDPRKCLGAASQGQVLKLKRKQHGDTFAAITQETTNSGFTLACAMENDLQDADSSYSVDEPDQKIRLNYLINAKEGEKFTLTKYMSYFTSQQNPKKDLVNLAKEIVVEGKKIGFDSLLKEQEKYLSDFWRCADVEIEGDPELQQGIRFNRYHLLQSVGKDGKTNIASKGVTGEGYGGHYFWDTESYVFPAFLYAKPDICRSLLEYRYSILPQSRNHAREMGHERGALYAWRTINGDECSPFFPGGSAQYHINADIIYALKTYTEVTNDMNFMVKCGAEMLFETARVWVDVGHYSPKKDNQFCIDCVTGPDEYTAVVNNNFYTNAMAQMNLQYAYYIARLMQKDYPAEYEKLIDKLDLDPAEVDAWIQAADKMYLPYDEKLGIHEQDDGFLQKALWPLEEIPADKHPLLMHYHYLVIYRHQICKQADALLTMFTLGNKFSAEDKKRNYDYYEKITTHDSSLSMCSFSILASEVGYHDKAYDYFAQTARLDLENGQKNTSDGIHAANMAGTWMGIVNGFGGMRMYDGELSFNPYLPKQWKKYSFRILFQGDLLQVTVKSGEVEYQLLEGKELEFSHRGEKVSLTEGKTLTLKI